MPKKKQPEKIVGALASGLKVLRYLSSRRVPTGVSRIAQETDLNLSTCFNILRTLVHEDLVTFDESSRAYAIGLGLAELARGALEQASYIRLIHPYLSAIVNEYAVTGTLWQRVGERVVLVDRVDHEATIRVHMSIGQRLPMYVGALGRSMAAYSNLSKTELRKHFTALRWENPPTFEDYWHDVERARYQQYAIDAETPSKASRPWRPLLWMPPVIRSWRSAQQALPLNLRKSGCSPWPTRAGCRRDNLASFRWR